MNLVMIILMFFVTGVAVTGAMQSYARLKNAHESDGIDAQHEKRYLQIMLLSAGLCMAIAVALAWFR